MKVMLSALLLLAYAVGVVAPATALIDMFGGAAVGYGYSDSIYEQLDRDGRGGHNT